MIKMPKRQFTQHQAEVFFWMLFILIITVVVLTPLNPLVKFWSMVILLALAGIWYFQAVRFVKKNESDHEEWVRFLKYKLDYIDANLWDLLQANIEKALKFSAMDTHEFSLLEEEISRLAELDFSVSQTMDSVGIMSRQDKREYLCRVFKVKNDPDEFLLEDDCPRSIEETARLLVFFNVDRYFPDLEIARKRIILERVVERGY